MCCSKCNMHTNHLIILFQYKIWLHLGWSQKEYIFNELPVDTTVAALWITCSKVLEDGLAYFPDLIRFFFFFLFPVPNVTDAIFVPFFCLLDTYASFNQNYLWNICRIAFFFNTACCIPRYILNGRILITLVRKKKMVEKGQTSHALSGNILAKSTNLQEVWRSHGFWLQHWVIARGVPTMGWTDSEWSGVC